MPWEQWEDYIKWLFDFEYKKLGIPTPDIVIYLKVDPEISQHLMTNRYAGDDSKKDIHEKKYGISESKSKSSQFLRSTIKLENC